MVLFPSFQDTCIVISFSLKSILFYCNPQVLFSFFPLFIDSTPFVLDSFSRMPINHEINFCFLLLTTAIFFEITLISLPFSSQFWEYLKYCLLPHLIAFFTVSCLHSLDSYINFILATIFFHFYASFYFLTPVPPLYSLVGLTGTSIYMYLIRNWYF